MTSRNDQCAICHSNLGIGPNASVNTAMGHTASGGVTHAFHLHCISKWQGMGNHTCPMCRASVNPWVQVNLT